jgi:hypothetical protein
VVFFRKIGNALTQCLSTSGLVTDEGSWLDICFDLGIMIPSGATAIYIEGPLLEGTFYVLFSLHVSAYLAIFRCYWVRLLQCGGLR